MMNKHRYLIGDVANLMGMSRDTLRHYEKRGLIAARKADNGYRYYTESDISRLVGILYQRKMDIGLDDIATLWDSQGSCNSPELLSDIISQRLQEEKEALLRHNSTIARLKMSQNDCENIRNYTGKVISSSIPDSYIIDSDLNFQQGISQWFEYVRNHPGLDTMYLFDEYQICTENRNCHISLNYQKSRFLLHKDMAAYTDYPIHPDLPATGPGIRCLSTFCISPDRIPAPDAVRLLLEYASANSISIQTQLFSTFLMQGMRNQEQCYYLQLFLPLSE